MKLIFFFLQYKGSWEKDNVGAMLQSKHLFPDIMLVDIGANLGVFSLPAAKAGMEVCGRF